MLSAPEPGRAKTGYEQEVIQRLMDICRLFRAGSRKYEHDKVFRFSVRPPENQDADWWRLVLFSAEICRCRYALRKTGTAGEPYIEVCFTGKGRQAELSAELLGFIWSRYYQSRRRAWRKYMRTMRQKQGQKYCFQIKPVSYGTGITCYSGYLHSGRLSIIQEAVMATQLAQAGNHLLTELVMEIKSGNLRRCEALGLTDNEIRLLNSLTIEDLHYLSQSPVSIITCQIHRENLRLLLTRAKEVHRQNQMIERCLRLGASIDLLNQYFGMTSLEVSARRRLSGIRGNAGRSQRLSDVQQTELWYRWKEEGMPEPDDPDCLQIMVSCAEKMNVSLTTVWNSVQEWHRDGILNSADRGKYHAG